MSIQFQLIGRYGCHLCEDMKDHLAILKDELDFEVTEIDINGNAELERLYGLKVPVLMSQEQEICHYTLDVERFRGLVNQLNNK